MPPIDLFTNAAINPVKASAVTAETSSPRHDEGSNPSASTTTSNAAANYPQAQPGIAAVPAPTAAASRYAPASVQPTSTATSELPHAPQPGAFPAPYPSSNILPPPKTGEAYVQPPRIEAAPSPQYYPPQMQVPPPTTPYRAQPTASTTSTTKTPMSTYPVVFPTSQYEAGRQSTVEGPPGYSQNPYASDLTPEQRRASDAMVEEGGLGRSENTSGVTSLGVDAWATAKNWAQKAGERISEVETEVWKRINK